MMGTDPQIYEDFINGNATAEQVETVLTTYKKLLTYVAPDHSSRDWYETAGQVVTGQYAMRNILAHIPHRDKAEFAGQLKEIWLAPSAEGARARAAALSEKYAAKYPKAIETLEDGLEDSLSFFAFPKLDARKIASTNMIRSRPVSSFNRLLISCDCSSGKAL